ncbi:protein of unknown function [Candidatus Hydrogenisulfobacillus filiaventi]|uniref:Uncharacterized protein n=1 Tax=Candidatus Hydrogenisulfobacillus filiaventi TaxID=2707344 RepID=A0A6F8ZIK9_9FIRM|nr:protein of unknown function [Candidatus Hydrogenisulfobacillus filiaventi]
MRERMEAYYFVPRPPMVALREAAGILMRVHPASGEPRMLWDLVGGVQKDGGYWICMPLDEVRRLAAVAHACAQLRDPPFPSSTPMAREAALRGARLLAAMADSPPLLLAEADAAAL